MDTRGIMKAQDDVLNDIERGLDNQKQQGLLMGSELERQKDLVGNKLDQNVDKAMKDLAEATQRANKMRKESGFMWLYITNFILFAVCLIIVFVGIGSSCN